MFAMWSAAVPIVVTGMLATFTSQTVVGQLVQPSDHKRPIFEQDCHGSTNDPEPTERDAERTASAARL
jgi:hypothetical protein